MQPEVRWLLDLPPAEHNGTGPASADGTNRWPPSQWTSSPNRSLDGRQIHLEGHREKLPIQEHPLPMVGAASAGRLLRWGDIGIGPA